MRCLTIRHIKQYHRRRRTINLSRPLQARPFGVAMPRNKKEMATTQEGLVKWEKSDKKNAQEGIMGPKLPLPQHENQGHSCF